MQETIKKILEIAVHAPSGENAQPWRFVVNGNSISVYNIPERDQSLYNFNQLGSYVAHGALIENIVIAASVYGYNAKPQLFPDKQNTNLTAVVELQKTNINADPLYSYIEKRCTNRKPYKKDASLSEKQLQEMIRSQSITSGGKVMFTQEQDKIKSFAQAGSINERVMFDNQFLHNFFFAHITWTKEEDDKKHLGFYIKTLEMPVPAQLMMRLFFKHWPIMHVFNKLGMADVIAKTNAKVYASSSAMGAVVMQNSQPEDFVNAGRIMQRVWLTATKLGLSIQPLTGVLFFMRRIDAEQMEHFTPRHIELIKNAYQDVYCAFNMIQNEAIIMMFRIGYGGMPSACAIKLPPNISFE